MSRWFIGIDLALVVVGLVSDGSGSVVYTATS
jgi:hypothetical protein